jgi:hypothetical protein
MNAEVRRTLQDVVTSTWIDPDRRGAEYALTVVAHARGLASEHGENPEYDRALIELTCRVLALEEREGLVRSLVVDS